MKRLWFVLWGEVRNDFRRPMDSTDWMIVLLLPVLSSIPFAIIWANT